MIEGASRLQYDSAHREALFHVQRFALTAALLGSRADPLGRRATRSRLRTDAALQRARDDWDKGDYVAALTTYQELLAGADAAAPSTRSRCRPASSIARSS